MKKENNVNLKILSPAILINVLAKLFDKLILFGTSDRYCDA